MTEQERADRLLELEAGIIEQNYGSLHYVSGRHYPNLDDAARERRSLAERFLRVEELLEGVCAWCNVGFRQGEERIAAAGRFIHLGKCTDEFNSLCTSVGGEGLAPHELRDYDAWSNGPTDAEVDEAIDGTIQISARGIQS